MTLEATGHLKLSQELSKAALDIFQRRSAIKEMKFTVKDDDSPVTALDQELDSTLREIITRFFPGENIISEEGEENDPSIQKTEKVWWIDPIDGTKEFIKGGPEWVLQLAQAINGKLTQAFVICPGLNQLYYARRGSGAFSQSIDSLNLGWIPKKLRVRTLPESGLTSIGSKSRSDANEARLLESLGVKSIIQRSSLGLKAIAIASGEADLYPNFSGLSHLWDLAAPQLILEEAGGKLLSSTHIDYSGHRETQITEAFVLCTEDIAPLFADQFRQVSTNRYDELLARFADRPNWEEVFEDGPRPKILFPIGISGSGKSSTLALAARKGWTIINADESRRGHLRKLADQGQSLLLNGTLKVPSPDLASDVFAPELRKALPGWLLEDLEIQLGRKANIVLDITNLTIERCRYLLKAHSQNYHAIAVLFPSLDLGINASRVKGRGSRGGLDIVDTASPDADRKRIEILEHLNQNFWGFLGSLKKRTNPCPPLPIPPTDLEIQTLDFTGIKGHNGDLDSYLKSQGPETQGLIKRLTQHDLFDEVFVVPAPVKSS